MGGGWLEFVIQGGALVVLAIFIFLARVDSTKLAVRLLDMIEAQVKFVTASTLVQQKLCDAVEAHTKRTDEQDLRGQGRDKEILDELRRLSRAGERDVQS